MAVPKGMHGRWADGPMGALLAGLIPETYIGIILPRAEKNQFSRSANEQEDLRKVDLTTTKMKNL